MAEITQNSDLAGLCREEDMHHFIWNTLSWGEKSHEQFSVSTDSASSYEDHTDSQTYQSEDEVPICSDLTIAPEDIKSGVRLTDANVFRIRTTLHGAKQKEWTQRWPYDFMTDGDIVSTRRPIGKGVVINVGGMGFYPIFRGYIALCGEQAGRYTSRVGPKKATRNALYRGFRVGQLLAMPDDFHENPAMYDLSVFGDSTSGNAVKYVYHPTDRVGLFESGQLKLAPLSAFTGFTPVIHAKSKFRFIGEEMTGLTRDDFNWLLEQEGKGKLEPSTLCSELQHLSLSSQLFKSFRPALPRLIESSDTSALEEKYDQELPAQKSSHHENSDDDSQSIDDESLQVKTSIGAAAPSVLATQTSSPVCSTASQSFLFSKYGRARKETKKLYRGYKRLMSKRKRQKAREIMKLADISDKIAAAKELLSTENAAEIIAAHKALKGLEVEYGRVSTGIQGWLKPKRNSMGQQLYNEMFQLAKAPDDDHNRLVEKIIIKEEPI